MENIKINPREMGWGGGVWGGMDWIDLAEDTDQ
jgi:hypothetical protein